MTSLPRSRQLRRLALALLLDAACGTDFNCNRQPASAFRPVNLTNARGTVKATMIPPCATMTHLVVKDGAGTERDVLLGWDDPTQYCSNPQHTYFGATIGRVANRIADCSFVLDGVEYTLSCNEKNFDTLHGGVIGWDRRVWAAVARTSSSVTWQYHSADGEMGFPGAVTVNVTHSLSDDGTWSIEYSATSDATTVLAMTNHAYFNLNANVGNVGTVLEHVLTLPTAPRALEVSGAPDYHLIPTGGEWDVREPAHAFLSFLQPKRVGADIDRGVVTARGGYDNAWVFDGWRAGGGMAHVATLLSPLTNISLEMRTDQPSVQVYTGNFLNGTDPSLRLRRKASQSHGDAPQYYQWRGAITLEAQAFPDAVHHPAFPSVRLEPGRHYVQRTAYTFSAAAAPRADGGSAASRRRINSSGEPPAGDAHHGVNAS